MAPARFERVSTLAYLRLGRAGVAAPDRLLAAPSPRDLLLLLAGRLLYGLGGVAHPRKRLRHRNALWHAPVVAAAACHYAVVLRLAQTAG